MHTANSIKPPTTTWLSSNGVCIVPAEIILQEETKELYSRL